MLEVSVAQCTDRSGQPAGSLRLVMAYIVPDRIAYFYVMSIDGPLVRVVRDDVMRGGKDKFSVIELSPDVLRQFEREKRYWLER